MTKIGTCILCSHYVLYKYPQTITTMYDTEINAWFLILAKESYNQQGITQFRFKALLGSKCDLLSDTYHLESHNLHILEVTQAEQCLQASIIRSSQEVYITGKLRKNHTIEVSKIRHHCHNNHQAHNNSCNHMLF